MSVSDEQLSKQRRKRDWLDWGQGIVTLLTALLAIWINTQQQILKSQQDNIDLELKKESTLKLSDNLDRLGASNPVMSFIYYQSPLRSP